MTEIELNTKIFRKDNLDIVYSISGKKHLNGILHYKLKSENSEEIFLSEYAVNDRFVTEAKHCAQPKNSVSRSPRPSQGPQIAFPGPHNALGATAMMATKP